MIFGQAFGIELGDTAEASSYLVATAAAHLQVDFLGNGLLAIAVDVCDQRISEALSRPALRAVLHPDGAGDHFPVQFAIYLIVPFVFRDTGRFQRQHVRVGRCDRAATAFVGGTGTGLLSDGVFTLIAQGLTSQRGTTFFSRGCSNRGTLHPLLNGSTALRTDFRARQGPACIVLGLRPCLQVAGGRGLFSIAESFSDQRFAQRFVIVSDLAGLSRLLLASFICLRLDDGAVLSTLGGLGVFRLALLGCELGHDVTERVQSALVAGISFLHGRVFPAAVTERRSVLLQGLELDLRHPLRLSRISPQAGSQAAIILAAELVAGVAACLQL